MVSAIELVAHGIRAVSAVSPRAGGDLAYRAFFATRPRMPVHPRDAATHAAARRGRVPVNGASVTTYEWGAGPRSVLLMHGWRGRASQFAPLVRELVAEGLHLVSFDAPAHGDSEGHRTDIRDWLDAARQLQDQHGRFEAIIGHSFGGLAALTAARTDVPTSLVVTIASAASPAAFVEEFARELQLRAPVVARLELRFRGRMGLDAEELVARFDAAQHPLPEPAKLLVVHDRDDRRIPDADSLRLHAAHQGRSRLLRTEDSGHTRVLSADAVLDAVIEQLQGTGRRAEIGAR